MVRLVDRERHGVSELVAGLPEELQFRNKETNGGAIRAAPKATVA
jgi:hypothetical protein